MFSFRRKPQQPAPEPAIRTSPSLPELSAQGIPWPSNLVDLSQLPPAVEQPASPPRGAAKTSFSADVRGGHVPFHKPWSSPGKAADAPAGPPIASLYASHPPSAFEGRKSSLGARQRPSQKRNRNPTTFNLMVRPPFSTLCRAACVGAGGLCSRSLAPHARLALPARPHNRHARFH